MFLKSASNLIKQGFNGFGNAVGNYAKFCLASTIIGAGSGTVYGAVLKAQGNTTDITRYTTKGALKGIQFATTPPFALLVAGITAHEKYDKQQNNGVER